MTRIHGGPAYPLPGPIDEIREGMTKWDYVVRSCVEGGVSSLPASVTGTEIAGLVAVAMAMADSLMSAYDGHHDPSPPAFPATTQNAEDHGISIALMVAIGVLKAATPRVLARSEAQRPAAIAAVTTIAMDTATEYWRARQDRRQRNQPQAIRGGGNGK